MAALCPPQPASAARAASASTSAARGARADRPGRFEHAVVPTPTRRKLPTMLSHRRVGGAVVRRLAGTTALALMATMIFSTGAFGEATSTAPPSATPPPPNDTLAAAQAIHTLPASINGTTVGATTEPGERESACDVPTTSSVWYSRAPARQASHRPRPGRLRRARRHDRRLPRGALAADLRRLPAHGSPGQGLAHVRRRQERPVRDPRGGAAGLPAGPVHARSVPADTRRTAARTAAARRRRQRPGRSHPEHQRRLRRSPCARASAT